MLISSLLSKLKLNQTLHMTSVLINKTPRSCTDVYSKRCYAFKSDLKIKWVRPTKVGCTLPEKSGDLKPLPSLDPSQLHEDFVDCPAVQDLGEEQKKLYTLGFLRHKQSVQMVRNQVLANVQRHSLDDGSMEAKIAKQTVSIRSLQLHTQKFPRDKRTKVILKELIDKRKKFLKYLRRWDYKRFEWLLEKLDIVYRPPPEHFHWVTRKESLTKLTQEHCDKIKNQRLEAYRQQLESEKKAFQKEKEELLKWIEEEERACGVDQSSEQQAKTQSI